MQRMQNRLPSILVWTVGLAYFSLTVWMHIWTLEAGVPLPGEPTKPHHQVCTWIGTSGETGFVDCLHDIRPIPIIAFDPAMPLRVPVLPVVSCAIQARAPPMPS